MRGKKSDPEVDRPSKMDASRYQALLDALPDIVVRFSVDRTICWLNAAGSAFYGADAVGRLLDEYFDDEDGSIAKQVRPLFQGQADLVQVEGWHRDLRGEARWLVCRCRAVRDSNGSLVEVLSTARDVTEQRTARSRLSEKQRTIDALMETAAHGIVSVNRDGTIRMVNKTAETMFGYDREELLGQSVEILLPEGLAAKHREHRQRYFDNPAPRPMGLSFRHCAKTAVGSRWRSV